MMVGSVPISSIIYWDGSHSLWRTCGWQFRRACTKFKKNSTVNELLVVCRAFKQNMVRIHLSWETCWLLRRQQIGMGIMVSFFRWRLRCHMATDFIFISWHSASFCFHSFQLHLALMFAKPYFKRIKHRTLALPTHYHGFNRDLRSLGPLRARRNLARSATYTRNHLAT